MVFLFVPNILGYIRYAIAFVTVFIYQTHPYLTVTLFIFSFTLDTFDGILARKLNQCSEFGAVLDMVCDRATDAVFLCFLGNLHPGCAWIFYGDIVLDITSHWFQMHAAKLHGEHHK